ncbi:MAG TPA: hypothetical protein VNZ54_10615 [bacterium]|nr:hypothetical protein [bacterium]HXB98494.1 hypothetical protein [bacterium]
MRFILMALLAAWAAAPARADTAGPAYVTPTVHAGGLDVRLRDLVLTPRPGRKVFVLWDAFSDRQALADLGDGALTATATALAKDYALKRYPKSRTVHVSVVEYTERDSYDTPRYESMKELGQFEFNVNAKTRRLEPKKP